MNLIFDTHAHYDDEAFDADREALLAPCPKTAWADRRPGLRLGYLAPRGGDRGTISPRLRRRRLASGKLRALHA